MIKYNLFLCIVWINFAFTQEKYDMAEGFYDL